MVLSSLSLGAGGYLMGEFIYDPKLSGPVQQNGFVRGAILMCSEHGVWV